MEGWYRMRVQGSSSRGLALELSGLIFSCTIFTVRSSSSSRCAALIKVLVATELAWNAHRKAWCNRFLWFRAFRGTFHFPGAHGPAQAEEWLQTQTFLPKATKAKGGWVLRTLQQSPRLLQRQSPVSKRPKWSPLSPTAGHREVTEPSH